MGMPCPGCKGNRGAIIARVLVTRRSPYGEWTYTRYTHRTRLADGRLKRKYCYVRVEPDEPPRPAGSSA
jgi:hypothetical protein